MGKTSSKVNTRIEWLSGQSVAVRLSIAGAEGHATEEFTGMYLETLPLGRAYFFVFMVDGRRRIIRTDNVVSMTEA